MPGQAPQETSYHSVHKASPVMAAWKPSRYVTLVGDAVHGMPPFAASGANTAVRGVHLLHQAIERHGVEGLTEDIIGRFEAELRGLAVEKIEQSFEAAW
ncbi:FAD/NAD(P)-binding domain-containing protein [Apiospora aurea]|uniref:FAD/NAD(P)-binding domain-containing protein n=1 Tax=Apiospora aurea TaxID=335848 RepID=A0ABR1QGX4_9PEZI